MTGWTYRGFLVEQQTGAPSFYLTTVSAKDLLAWCDVPRAKGEYMAGFQRSLNDERSKSLTEYLNLSSENIVPGAIIVAVDRDHVTFTSRGDVATIAIQTDARSFDEKLSELFGTFSTRLSSEELSSAGVEFSAIDWDGSKEEASAYPKSYLASLVKELQQALTSWDTLSIDRQAAITDYIDGVSKPGLIIDGQHRVTGAANADNPILLPVVLLPGLAHAEQVFQFYVLNSKAKPLLPTELRRIVSTSLGNSEISALYSRLRQAGIDADESRWTLDMNTRPDSSFRDLINFGFKINGAVIKENVADQLVRGFMRMPKKYRQLVDPLGTQWEDAEGRLSRFFWLWKAIKQIYDTAWTAAVSAAQQGNTLHQLFMKVSLLTLQKFLLDRFLTALPYRTGQPPPLSSEQEIQSMVQSTLHNLPPEFFMRPWEAKQIDTAPGRERLYDAMEKVWNNQGKIHGNMWPFKEK